MERRLVFRHTVEGLFLRAFGPAMTPAFRESLQRIGLDLDAIPTAIDAHLYRTAYELLRAQIHPGLPPDEADVQMARRFIDGYFETVIGQLTRMMVKVLPVETHIERSSRNFEAAVNFVTSKVEKIGPRAYRMRVSDFSLSPHFTMGILGRMFEIGGVTQYDVRLERQEGRAFSILMSWR
jgi:uncharacterized protein (TIGR02265 family)